MTHPFHICIIFQKQKQKLNKKKTGLLNRQRNFRNYIKPWMKRKRAKEVRKYKAMERGVSNLKKYVQFINDRKQD